MKRSTSTARSGILRVAVFAIVVAAVVCAGVVGLHVVADVMMPMELKILGIAFAVGLDVLALSIAVGIMSSRDTREYVSGSRSPPPRSSCRLPGYAIGSGAGRVIGTIADYVGFAVLAGVGIFVIRESYDTSEMKLRVDGGWGLVAACASISLDSLGIGVSLPGARCRCFRC